MSLKHLEELEKKISVYDNAHYNLDLSLITDEEYDELVKEYRALLKLHPNFVPSLFPGFVENEGPKVALTEPMLSINKINNWDKLEKLVQRYGSYVAEEKEDGVGVRLVYDKNGSIQFIHLKGNGFEGKDISHRKHLITGIPDVIDNDTGEVVNVTGEVVCFVEDFKIYKEQAADDVGPERNVVSGFLRRDEAGEDDGELPLQFIAFHASKNIRDKCLEYKELRNWLTTNGFEIPAQLDELPKTKPESVFPIDGIVVKQNDLKLWDDQSFTGYNTYSACFKYPSEVVTTKTTGVSWNVNSQGYLKGVLMYNPVKIGTILTSKCSFYYPDIYIRNGMRIGSTIEITRGNEIIPKLLGIVDNNGQGELITFPETCPCCEEPLNKEAEGVYRCVNVACSGQLGVRLRKAVGPFGLDIDGLGLKRLETLIEADVIVLPAQLFTLTLDDLIGVGLSKKVAKKILVQLDEAETKPLANWIYSAAIPKLGKSRCLELQSWFKENPCEDTEELMLLLASEKMTELFGLDGLSIISYVSNNSAELKEFFDNISYVQTTKSILDAIPVGITGICDMDRKSLVEKFLEHGYWVDNKVTMSTFRLLVGDKPSPGKVGLAERYDIPLIHIKGLTFDGILKQLEKR